MFKKFGTNLIPYDTTAPRPKDKWRERCLRAVVGTEAIYNRRVNDQRFVIDNISDTSKFVLVQQLTKLSGTFVFSHN